MWSGVILMEDDAFTSCQFWPLFLDFFVQFYYLATVDILVDSLVPLEQLKINNTFEIHQTLSITFFWWISAFDVDCMYLSLCVVSIFHKKKMSSTLQQRVCIKFCVKNGFDGAQTLEMLEKCFGNDTLKKCNVFRWHERFRSGRESVEDDECSGRP